MHPTLNDFIAFILMHCLFIFRNLDLRKFIINEESNSCDVYDLIGVTNHYGGLGGGHCKSF